MTFSVPTLDREIWRRTEPGTAPPQQRLRALKQLVDAGIKASVGMAPILPGLSDKPELLADVVRAAREAGATGVWANLLYLKPGTKEHFMSALERDWPELLPEYERLYERHAYLPKSETEPARGPRARARSRARDPRSAAGEAHAAAGSGAAPTGGVASVPGRRAWRAEDLEPVSLRDRGEPRHVRVAFERRRQDALGGRLADLRRNPSNCIGAKPTSALAPPASA